jgi:hypothetical protein
MKGKWIMFNVLIVVPAYGRDYKSQKEVKEAWAQGKDFVIASMHSEDYGRYVNKEDAPKKSFVNIRYKKGAGLVVIKT